MTSQSFDSHVEELVAHNKGFAQQFEHTDLQVAPKRHLAIVACMDSRMDIFAMLGLENGDAHIIRNAGGVITDDVIRSLCLSQRLLGTNEILLIHHTDCGLQKVKEADFKEQIETETGIKPEWSLETFDDPYRDVKQSMARLNNSPFILNKQDIRGFVYDVTDGLIHEVDA